MNVLKAKRGRVKTTVTNIGKYVAQLNRHSRKDDIILRLEKLEQAAKEFYEIIDDINDLAEDETFEDQTAEVDDFEKRYFEYGGNLRTALSGLKVDDVESTSMDQFLEQQALFLEKMSATQNAPQQIRLPPIQIPAFGGDYKEWKTFYDLFNSSIHKNGKLSNVQKFQYLRSFLKDEAESLIKHMSITDANYAEAWNRLSQRYDQKTKIVTSFIKSYIEQPALTQQSANGIRELGDTADEIIRGLRALGPDAEERDHWLVYILVEKMDPESKKLWFYEKSEVELPTFQMLIEFMNKQASALEVNEAASKVTTEIRKRPTFAGKSIKANFSNHFVCPVCKGNHRVYACDQFKSMNTVQRKECVLNHGMCYNCLSVSHESSKCQSNSRCRVCNKPHNTMIHASDPCDNEHQPQPQTFLHTANSTTVVNDQSPEPLQSHIEPASPLASTSKSHNVTTATAEYSLLPTALIKVKNSFGNFITARALLDCGSQSSFITQSLVKTLGLARRHARQIVNGLANSEAGTTKGICSVELFSSHDSKSQIQIDALILPKITGTLPDIELHDIDYDFAKHLILADSEFYKPTKVDILIGVDYFFDIIQNGKISHSSGSPYAQRTLFGWVIGGKITGPRTALTCNHSIIPTCLEGDVDKTLRRFWEVEEPPTPTKLMSPDDIKVEEQFLATFSRNDDGRFIVRLPFKSADPNIGSSLVNATNRLQQMERRFAKTEALRESYSSFINEYSTLSHMEQVPPEQIAKRNSFYLPHHAVFKESSSTTKIRVVFDGSSKSTSGNSLNDELYVGPQLQDDIFTILTRFRCHKFAFTADAAKMYRQVLIHPDDRDYQRIVWRSKPTEQFTHFRLNTVTYGTAPGAFLAIRCLQQLAKEECSNFPEAAKIVLSDFYVDDMMSGAESETKAIQLFHDLVDLLAKGGFLLRKWATNCDVLRKEIPDSLLEPQLIDISDDSESSTIKVLGVSWNPHTDNFSYKVNLPLKITSTKRQILSDSGRIYDPLGWAAPVIIRIKILFQLLWLQKLQWDESVTLPLSRQWEAFRDDLTKLEQLEIPRWLPIQNRKIEFHGFCDASESAYSAVIYCRTILEDRVVCNIIASKTKVAPLKQVSLPRLELCGALLLSKLFKSIISTINANEYIVHAWTDSTIVLAWLSEFPRTWKTYVANRVTQILEIMPHAQWHHVPGSQNPADCASRGISANDLINHTLWWHGPEFILHNELHTSSITDTELNAEQVNNERRDIPVVSNQATVAPEPDPLLQYASWTKLRRVVATCLRFTSNSRNGVVQKNGALSIAELDKATKVIVRRMQVDSFANEIQTLQTCRGNIKMSSKLISLNPFLDEESLLRVGGRIQHSILGENMKHPIILNKNHPITKLIAEDVHLRYFHAGQTFMLTQLRQRYWILGARSLVRKIVHSCPVCRRYSEKAHSQIMGSLPDHRVQATRAFAKTGCDFAGPIILRQHKGRNAKHIKGYIAIFVCLATKAIHLEAVTDLSTDAFISCLRRFCGRRGVPSDIFSDNATNFVGAKRALAETLQLSIHQHHNIANILSKDGISWHFIPPAAPQFGGIWEAGVKSVKFHFKRVTNNLTLTFEELYTLLTQIEAVLNSRPLCLISNDDINPLTPGHFLIGQPLTLIPEPDLQHVPVNRLSRWQLIQSTMQGFWRRWHSEYLTSLQQRPKWRKHQANLKVGDVVIVKEPNLPPGKWSLGRIEFCHPGDDKQTRVVTIRSKDTLFKRPITKIIKIIAEDT